LTAQHPAVWLVFSGLIVGLLVVDLFVIGRAGALSVRSATRWSAAVIAVALLFGIHVFATGGAKAAAEYYAGYLIELSLSVDNLFVFLLIFQYFAVPSEAQPRVLHWGILSAIVLRGIMIVVGVLALERFGWLIYVLGALLVVTAIKMGRQGEVRVEPEKNPLVRVARRFIRVTPGYEGTAFFVRSHAGWVATPLVLVVLVVEWSDVVFAIDSIPAIFAVTRDPFIVYSSNVFAILGLRAMYFVLASAMDRFLYLKPGVAVILGFVGLKMVLSAWVHVPIGISLGVIAATLATAMLLSVLKLRRDRALAPDPGRS
jgi:tellurite resistance protein TerC